MPGAGCTASAKPVSSLSSLSITAKTCLPRCSEDTGRLIQRCCCWNRCLLTRVANTRPPLAGGVAGGGLSFAPGRINQPALGTELPAVGSGCRALRAVWHLVPLVLCLTRAALGSLWSAELLLQSLGDGGGDQRRERCSEFSVNKQMQWLPRQAPAVWVRERWGLSGASPGSCPVTGPFQSAGPGSAGLYERSPTSRVFCVSSSHFSV